MLQNLSGTAIGCSHAPKKIHMTALNNFWNDQLKAEIQELHRSLKKIINAT